MSTEQIWKDCSEIRLERANQHEAVWSWHDYKGSCYTQVSDCMLPYFVQLCPWPFEIVDCRDETHLVRINPLAERTDWGCE